jgi:hypothetical protein
MTETIALLKTSLAEALATVRDTAKALRVKADADRETLLALIAGMRETSHEMAQLAEICGEAGDLLHETSEETYRVVDVVNDSLSGMDIIPECSYEKFYAYCAECGCELTTDDDVAFGDYGEVLCPDCANFLEAVNEMEEELAETEDEDEESAEDEHPADCNCAECEVAETCDTPATDTPVDPAE